jgi:hypothetical protein
MNMQLPEHFMYDKFRAPQKTLTLVTINTEGTKPRLHTLQQDLKRDFSQPEPIL